MSQLIANQGTVNSVPIDTIHCCILAIQLKQIKKLSVVILATALIKVTNESGRSMVLRALLDSASEASFITEHWVQQLKLKKFKINTPISGIGATGITNARSGVNLNFTSLIDDKHSFTIHALTLPKITGLLPSTNLDVNNWVHIKSLKLADPQFNKPAKIDVLLGADVFFTLLRSGQLAAPDGLLSVQETVLGWILAGKIQQPPATHIKVHHSTCSTEHILRQFWESEELSASPPLTQEEVQCENHFKTTFSRNEQSRYVVKLPFKQSQPSLGSSRDSAILRLKQIERKLARNPELHKHYSDFLHEYVDLKHMEPVPIESIPIQQSYYMPHHPIVKECSLTTKVRVVFDASHKSSNDLSLNDNLMVGPKLQSDLIIILLRFRLHAVAVTADIEKMYRQVFVAKEHVDYQRIVWREKPSDPIQDYNLLTVTYGTASAPYHAIRCLHQLAYDEGKKFPEAAEVLMENFYVDDLILSVPSADQAIHLHQQLVEVLQSAGFHLRKWASNNNLVLDAINQELTSDDNKLRITSKESIKTLGLEWHPRVDQFRFTTASSQHSFAQTLTKRSMLSSIARIFDPLGLLSPATIRAKILLQSLWKLQLDWDEEVDPTTQRHWHDYIHDLKFLDEIHIDRCISLSGECHFELHVFSDASEKAYAAVVYLKSMDSNGCCMVSLVASKAKVAPLKPVSIPRLELCAALLASKLGRLIIESLKIKIEKTYAWTDSMVTLSWISSHASRWKSFVAHRVLQIQENMPEAIWKHVPGDENPADCASRGITVHHLASHELWWKGPAWLASNDWPNSLGSFNNEISQQEERTSSTKVLLTSITLDLSIIDRYSNLTKLVRVVALCFRLYKNTKLTTETRIHGFLSVIELNQALNTLIRLVQRVEFSEEIQSLNAGKPISTKSRILPLNPYLDSINLLRVGGRLQKAKIPELQKHPILLPQKGQLTTLIIQDVHLKRLHAGPQLVMSILAGRYWIINCRDVVRRIIRKCVKCFRYQANASQQLMGTLPTARVNPSRAFRHVGVDYAGPLLTKYMKTRSKITYKTYIVLFICFATRAIHLELVSDMSTAAFIATLKRFVARRGKPVEIYSDCGTNFVGANRELKDFLTLIKSKMHNETIGNYLAEEGIQWVFNPPAAPHMGGLWEAGVRSVKHHLKRVVGEVKLTFEELYTLLVQIESCLNSRPITAMSNDPADLSPLTPGHFLIGESLTAIPEPDLSHLTMNRLSRWQLIQKLLQHFWHRWRMEYLSRLQQRPKWYKKEENLKPNDLVLIREDNLPPLQWKLGRIVQTHPGEDGLVRTVTVRSATGEVKRPITKISPLPINEVI